jgi:hypothetical protein
MTRTLEESLSLIDRVVARCVREPDFAASVLTDPDGALRDYTLNEDELDDFRALSAGDRDAILSGWAALRDSIEHHRREAVLSGGLTVRR